MAPPIAAKSPSTMDDHLIKAFNFNALWRLKSLVFYFAYFSLKVGGLEKATYVGLSKVLNAIEYVIKYNKTFQ